MKQCYICARSDDVTPGLDVTHTASGIQACAGCRRAYSVRRAGELDTKSAWEKMHDLWNVAHQVFASVRVGNDGYVVDTESIHDLHKALTASYGVFPKDLWTTS